MANVVKLKGRPVHIAEFCVLPLMMGQKHGSDLTSCMIRDQMNRQKQQDPRDIVYSPNDVSKLALAELKTRRENPGAGVRTHITSLDETVIPLRPGDLVIIMANSSHGKTSLMQYILRQEAKKIIEKRAEPEKEIVVFVTWETAVEELGMYDISSYTKIPSDKLYQGNVSGDDWKNLETAAFKRSTMPVWVIGHSIARRKKRPSLTMSNVLESLWYIEETFGLHPTLICLDYLQEMEPEIRDTRRLQIFDCMSRSKDTALAMGCPVLLGCQAKREVLERDWKLPRMSDGEETSAIEHTADKVISLWYPKMTEDTDEPLGNTGIDITNQLMIVGLMKQRYGPAGQWWPLFFRPEINDFQSMILEDRSLTDEGSE